MVDLGATETALHIRLLNGGKVVGFDYFGIYRVFYWRRNSRVVNLDTLGGAVNWVTAVNARGLVVGFSKLADGTTHAALWNTIRDMQFPDIELPDMAPPFDAAE